MRPWRRSPPAYWSLIEDVWAPPAPPTAPNPLWLRNRHRTQWFATLARGRAVYSHATEPTSTFAATLLRRARNPKVRRVIVDVRLNGGGTTPRLASHRRPAQPGAEPARPARAPDRARHLLGGRQLRRRGGSLHPCTNRRRGGRRQPHTYGDSEPVELDALGWTVHVPPQYVEVLGRSDERASIEPDVPVQIGAADHFAGRDPVLAKALAIR